MHKAGLAVCLLGTMVVASAALAAPLKTRDVIELWPAGVGPGWEKSPVQLTVTERSKVAYWPDRIITGITRPNLTAIVPDKPNGTAVIVAPGGAYSPDLHVTKASPPTFIVFAEDDPVVPPENSKRYCNALKAQGVPCSLHAYKEGGHGFGIRDARQLPVSQWPNVAAAWMKSRKLIK